MRNHFYNFNCYWFRITFCSFSPLVSLCYNKFFHFYLFQVMSRDTLAAMHKKQADMEENNQNPWTFKQIAHGNMLGIRRVLSPFDLHNNGRFTGKFHLLGRVWQAQTTGINTVYIVTPSRPHCWRSNQNFERLRVSTIFGNLLSCFFLCKCTSEFNILLKRYVSPFFCLKNK